MCSQEQWGLKAMSQRKPGGHRDGTYSLGLQRGVTDMGHSKQWGSNLLKQRQGFAARGVESRILARCVGLSSSPWWGKQHLSYKKYNQRPYEQAKFSSIVSIRDSHVSFSTTVNSNGTSLVLLLLREKKPLKVERRYTVRKSWVRGSVQAGAARHLMRLQKYWERALLSGVDAVGGVAQQDFSDSDKVHDLGYAEERGDDQRAATGPLEECARTLLCQDLPAVGERTRGVADGATRTVNICVHQCTSFLPDTVHHSVIGLLVSSFFEWLQPCLYHWWRQTWLIIIIIGRSRRRRSMLIIWFQI